MLRVSHAYRAAIDVDLRADNGRRVSLQSLYLFNIVLRLGMALHKEVLLKLALLCLEPTKVLHVCLY